ncbi:unnamed protein product [Calypogeia fissa]
MTMAEVAEVEEANTLVTLASYGASFVKQRLEGAYKKSNAVEQFPNKVLTLHSKVELWNTLLKRFGVEEDDMILPTVAAIEEARKWLEKEEERLLQLQSSCCLRRKCSKTFFPDELTTSFQNVIDSIDVVPLTKTPKEEALEALEKARQRRNDSIATLPFAPDSRYVPISGSLLELKNALEGEDGCQVVTLYGSPGSGKSMMAQHLALCYQDSRQLPLNRKEAPDSLAHFRDGVFYLDCGPDADSRAKHLELLHNLSSRPEELVAIGRSGHEQDAKIDSDYDIHNRLCARLSGQSVLIILDDVWNQELVQQVLVPEKSVKYLLVSRKRGVWEDAVHVKLEMPNMEEARAILANYTGGQTPGSKVTAELQVLVEDVIKASDFHPLVLANWGTALKGEGATDPAEWRAARDELFDVVSDEEDSFSGPLGFGNLMYPRTVVSSTIMAMNVLPSEAQSLLLLATLCSGPCVPEQVLRILFESVYGIRRRTYLRWRNQLEDRGFIQVQAHALPWSTLPVRTFSISRLRQYFIRKVKKESISFLVQSILSLRENSHADTDLVTALSAIYGVEELRAGAAKQLGVDIKQNVSVWRCVQPFVWLLEIEGGEVWEEQQQCLQATKQVICQYIGQGQLAHNDLLRLLQQPKTSAATCWAVELMAWNWSTLTLWGALSDKPQKTLFRWSSKNIGVVLAFKAILDLLKKDVAACTQRLAANALVAFAWASQDINLPAASFALAELVTLLSRDGSALAREAGARAVGRLAHLKGRNSQDINTVGEFPGVVEALVRLLVEDASAAVQTAAVEALYLLAGDRSSAGRILATRGALQKLADLLGKSTDPDAQQFSVLALYNLSRHEDIVLARETKVNFVYLRDANSATSSSSGEGTLSLRRPAEEQENNNQIVGVPGMLRGLVGLLLHEVKPVLQMLAGSTLRKLAEVEVNRVGIAKFPGALEGLARILCSQDFGPSGLDVIAQAEAAETLVILAEVDLNVKQIPGAVDGLKRLLAQDVHPYVQERAAKCLTIIDPIRANQVTLHAGVAYRARAIANIHMGLFHQALADLEKLAGQESGSRQVFHEFRYVHAMLGDYDSALAIADDAIQVQPLSHFDWAERGVLKRLMGEYEGALADFNTAIDLNGDVYEYRKQRAYAKFLMGDEEGARLDVEATAHLNPNTPQSKIRNDAKFSLCELSVAFLGHAL